MSTLIHPLPQVVTLTQQASVLHKREILELIKTMFAEIVKRTANHGNAKNSLALLLISLNSFLTDDMMKVLTEKMNQLNYKRIKPKCHETDLMSTMPLDLVVNLGQFLTRTETATMRNVNKLFYVEMSAKKFKINRQTQNEPPLSVNYNIFESTKFNLPQSVLFEYPTKICIDLGKNYDWVVDNRDVHTFNKTIAKYYEPWFKNCHNSTKWNEIFTNVNVISWKYHSIDMLSYIPIATILNDNLSTLHLEFDLKNQLYMDDDYTSIQIFDTNYKKYFTTITEYNQKPRMIKCSFSQINDTNAQRMAQSLVNTLKPNIQHLSLIGCHINIVTGIQFTKLFPSTLQQLEICDECAIWIRNNDN